MVYMRRMESEYETEYDFYKGFEPEQWLELRRRGIGGSDASVVMRQNPYRSVIQLWEEKTGRLPVEDTGNEYTYWGKEREMDAYGDKRCTGLFFGCED